MTPTALTVTPPWESSQDQLGGQDVVAEDNPDQSGLVDLPKASDTTVPLVSKIDQVRQPVPETTITPASEKPPWETAAPATNSEKPPWESNNAPATRWAYNKKDPASIRSNNPGAMWDNAIAKEFGSKGKENLNDGLGQNNNIALFDDPVHGAAAQFALLSRHYSGMNLGSAIRKWSGGNDVGEYLALIKKQTGLGQGTQITPQFLASPDGISLIRAMAKHEAGRDYPLNQKDWEDAQSLGLKGTVHYGTQDQSFAKPSYDPTTGKTVNVPLEEGDLPPMDPFGTDVTTSGSFGSGHPEPKQRVNPIPHLDLFAGNAGADLGKAVGAGTSLNTTGANLGAAIGAGQSSVGQAQGAIQAQRLKDGTLKPNTDHSGYPDIAQANESNLQRQARLSTEFNHLSTGLNESQNRLMVAQGQLNSGVDRINHLADLINQGRTDVIPEYKDMLTRVNGIQGQAQQAIQDHNSQVKRQNVVAGALHEYKVAAQKAIPIDTSNWGRFQQFLSDAGKLLFQPNEEAGAPGSGTTVEAERQVTNAALVRASQFISSLPETIIKSNSDALSNTLGYGNIDPSIYKTDPGTKISGAVANIVPYFIPGVNTALIASQVAPLTDAFDKDPKATMKAFAESISPLSSDTIIDPDTGKERPVTWDERVTRGINLLALASGAIHGGIKLNEGLIGRSLVKNFDIPPEVARGLLDEFKTNIQNETVKQMMVEKIKNSPGFKDSGVSETDLASKIGEMDPNSPAFQKAKSEFMNDPIFKAKVNVGTYFKNMLEQAKGSRIRDFAQDFTEKYRDFINSPDGAAYGKNNLSGARGKLIDEGPTVAGTGQPETALEPPVATEHIVEPTEKAPTIKESLTVPEAPAVEPEGVKTIQNLPEETAKAPKKTAGFQRGSIASMAPAKEVPVEPTAPIVEPAQKSPETPKVGSEPDWYGEFMKFTGYDKQLSDSKPKVKPEAYDHAVAESKKRFERVYNNAKDITPEGIQSGRWDIENKFSRKVLESIHGIKLPASNKDTKVALIKLIGEDKYQAHLDAQQAEHDRKLADKEKSKQDEIDKEQENWTPTYKSFVNSHSAMKAGLVRKVLDTQLRMNGKVATRAEHIERLVSEGWKVEQGRSGRIIKGPSGSLFLEKDVTKTALDYAQHIIDNGGVKHELNKPKEQPKREPAKLVEDESSMAGLEEKYGDQIDSRALDSTSSQLDALASSVKTFGGRYKLTTGTYSIRDVEGNITDTKDGVQVWDPKNKDIEPFHFVADYSKWDSATPGTRKKLIFKAILDFQNGTESELPSEHIPESKPEEITPEDSPIAEIRKDHHVPEDPIKMPEAWKNEKISKTTGLNPSQTKMLNDWLDKVTEEQPEGRVSIKIPGDGEWGVNSSQAKHLKETIAKASNEKHPNQRFRETWGKKFTGHVIDFTKSSSKPAEYKQADDETIIKAYDGDIEKIIRGYPEDQQTQARAHWTKVAEEVADKNVKTAADIKAKKERAARAIEVSRMSDQDVTQLFNDQPYSNRSQTEDWHHAYDQLSKRAITKGWWETYSKGDPEPHDTVWGDTEKFREWASKQESSTNTVPSDVEKWMDFDGEPTRPEKPTEAQISSFIAKETPTYDGKPIEPGSNPDIVREKSAPYDLEGYWEKAGDWEEFVHAVFKDQPDADPQALEDFIHAKYAEEEGLTGTPENAPTNEAVEKSEPTLPENEKAEVPDTKEEPTKTEVVNQPEADDKGMRGTHARSRVLRKIMNNGKFTKLAAQKMVDQFNEAIESGFTDPKWIAEETNLVLHPEGLKRGKVLDSIEQLGFIYRNEELALEYNDAIDQGKPPEVTERIKALHGLTQKVLDIQGSRAGKTLQIRQIGLDDDLRPITIVFRAKQEWKKRTGKEMPEARLKQMEEDLAREKKERDAAVAELEALKKSREDTILNANHVRRESQRSKGMSPARMEAKAEVERVVRKLLGQTNMVSGLEVAGPMLKPLGKLLWLTAKELGLNSVADIKEAVKAEYPDLEEKEITDAIGAYRTSLPKKNKINQNLKDLAKEIRSASGLDEEAAQLKKEKELHDKRVKKLAELQQQLDSGNYGPPGEPRPRTDIEKDIAKLQAAIRKQRDIPKKAKENAEKRKKLEEAFASGDFGKAPESKQDASDDQKAIRELQGKQKTMRNLQERYLSNKKQLDSGEFLENEPKVLKEQDSKIRKLQNKVKLQETRMKAEVFKGIPEHPWERWNRKGTNIRLLNLWARIDDVSSNTFRLAERNFRDQLSAPFFARAAEVAVGERSLSNWKEPVAVKRFTVDDFKQISDRAYDTAMHEFVAIGEGHLVDAMQKYDYSIDPDIKPDSKLGKKLAELRSSVDTLKSQIAANGETPEIKAELKNIERQISVSLAKRRLTTNAGGKLAALSDVLYHAWYREAAIQRLSHYEAFEELGKGASDIQIKEKQDEIIRNIEDYPELEIAAHEYALIETLNNKNWVSKSEAWVSNNLFNEVTDRVSAMGMLGTAGGVAGMLVHGPTGAAVGTAVGSGLSFTFSSQGASKFLLKQGLTLFAKVMSNVTWDATLRSPVGTAVGIANAAHERAERKVFGDEYKVGRDAKLKIAELFSKGAYGSAYIALGALTTYAYLQSRKANKKTLQPPVGLIKQGRNGPYIDLGTAIKMQGPATPALYGMTVMTAVQTMNPKLARELIVGTSMQMLGSTPLESNVKQILDLYTMDQSFWTWLERKVVSYSPTIPVTKDWAPRLDTYNHTNNPWDVVFDSGNQTQRNRKPQGESATKDGKVNKEDMEHFWIGLWNEYKFHTPDMFGHKFRSTLPPEPTKPIR